MLRTALSDGLTTQSSVLMFIGERFRPKADLPEWTSDEDITRHLLKYGVCCVHAVQVDVYTIFVLLISHLFCKVHVIRRARI